MPDTPVRDQRAERHLMRMRGAGPKAVATDFAFTFTGASSTTVVDQGAGRPYKRSKIVHSDARLTPSICPERPSPHEAHKERLKQSAIDRDKHEHRPCVKPDQKLNSRTLSSVHASKCPSSIALQTDLSLSVKRAVPPASGNSQAASTRVPDTSLAEDTLGIAGLLTQPMHPWKRQENGMQARPIASRQFAVIHNASTPSLTGSRPRDSSQGMKAASTIARSSLREGRNTTSTSDRPGVSAPGITNASSRQVLEALDVNCYVPPGTAESDSKRIVCKAANHGLQARNKAETACRLQPDDQDRDPLHQFDLALTIERRSAGKISKDKARNEAPVDRALGRQSKSTMAMTKSRKPDINPPRRAVPDDLDLSHSLASAASRAHTKPRRRYRDLVQCDDGIDIDDLITNITTLTR